jgi:hypothetical protein
MADAAPGSEVPEPDPGREGSEGADASGGENAGRPSEEELRAAYEAELERITSADLLLQTTASLINIGAHRLGLTGGGDSTRDLEQVRDSIDGVRALLPILERRGAARQLPAIRDALSQLQLAYAREVQAGPQTEQSEPADAQETTGEGPASEPAQTGEQPPGSEVPSTEGPADPRRPGPAEASGRLWIPGKG